jgi:hypothetical protein
MSFIGGGTAYKGDLGSPAFPFAKPNAVGGMGMLFQLNNRMFIGNDMYFEK